MGVNLTYDPKKVSRSKVEDDGTVVFVCYHGPDERKKRLGGVPKEAADG